MKTRTKLAIPLGFAAGIAAGIVGKIVYDKVSGEIKNDMSDQVFTSPEGNNTVTVSYGSSSTAKGLTYIKVKAVSDSNDCKLIAFAKKSPKLFNAEWADNDSFKLLIGCGKRKQCCDVKFEENNIIANYYLLKTSD